MSRSLRAAIGACALALATMPGVALAKGGDTSSQPRGTHTRAAAIQRSGRRHPQHNHKRVERRRRRPAIQAGHRRAHFLVPGTGYQEAAGSIRVRSLQRRLAHLGFTPGPIDGHYGPLTTRSVQRFQAAAGLAIDGIAGPHTVAALSATRHAVMAPGAGYRQSRGLGPRALAAAATGMRLGFTPGPIDGRYGPLTTSAVNRFQHDRHLPVSGLVGLRTLVALRLTAHRRSPLPASATTSHRHPPGTQPPAARTAQPQPAVLGGPILLALALLALVALVALVHSYYATRRQVRSGRGTPPAAGTGPSRPTASGPGTARNQRTQAPRTAGNQVTQAPRTPQNQRTQAPRTARNHRAQQRGTALDQLVDLSWLALADRAAGGGDGQRP